MEEALHQAAWPRLLLLALGIWILSLGYSRLRRARKISRLGARAPWRKTFLPYGVDMIYDAVTSFLGDDNLRFWHKNFMLYGNPANPYNIEAYPAGERIILTADPENIKAVLATQFHEFGKGKQFNDEWHGFLGDSIFTTDGKQWSDSRQLIRPQFIKDRVSDLEVFEHHAQVLIPLLGGKGQEVDVKELFFRFTLDAATDFLLGRSVGSLGNSQSSFAGAFQEVQKVQCIISRMGYTEYTVFSRLCDVVSSLGLTKYGLAPKGMDSFVRHRTFKQHLNTINAFVEPFIEQALALPQDELEKRTKSEHGYTFLHAIAYYTRDRRVLRDQLVAVLLAGRDTTACTLSWLFFELGRNDAIVKRLRKEIESTVGWERAPTYAELKNMKFLSNCLNETLRLYPVVPFNVRVPLRDTTLPTGGGPDGTQPIAVLKDTQVGYSTHYMQLRPDIYPPTSASFPSPHLFAPERWEHWQPRPWTYIPFNGGNRICVGQQFALTEMAYTAVRVLQKFGRIEAGREGGGAAQLKKTRGPWMRGRAGYPETEPSLVEKTVESRDSAMKSEIVLQPAGPVKLRFYEA